MDMSGRIESVEVVTAKGVGSAPGVGQLKL
jgi:hypothetical protein